MTYTAVGGAGDLSGPRGWPGVGWAVGFVHCAPCSSSVVLQEASTTPGRDWEVCEALLVVTVFGSINGSRWEGAEVVLATRRSRPCQNPLVLRWETSTHYSWPLKKTCWNCSDPLTRGFFSVNRVSVFSFDQSFKCRGKFVFDYRPQYVESQKSRVWVLILSRLLRLPALGWVLYQFLCFWARDSSMWIFRLCGGRSPNPCVVQGSALLVFSPEFVPSFPLAWRCSRALFQNLSTNGIIHVKSKPWPNGFPFLPGWGAISSGTHLLWAPKTLFLNAHPLTLEQSYLGLSDPRRTNPKLLPGVCTLRLISPKFVHLATSFILNQVSVICSLLALVCTCCFFMWRWTF